MNAGLFLLSFVLTQKKVSKEKAKAAEND